MKAYKTLPDFVDGFDMSSLTAEEAQEAELYRGMVVESVARTGKPPPNHLAVADKIERGEITAKTLGSKARLGYLKAILDWDAGTLPAASPSYAGLDPLRFSADPPLTVTALADGLGMSRQWASKLVNQDGMPQRLEGAKRWLEQRRLRRPETPPFDAAANRTVELSHTALYKLACALQPGPDGKRALSALKISAQAEHEGMRPVEAWNRAAAVTGFATFGKPPEDFEPPDLTGSPPSVVEDLNAQADTPEKRKWLEQAVSRRRERRERLCAEIEAGAGESASFIEAVSEFDDQLRAEFAKAFPAPPPKKD